MLRAFPIVLLCRAAAAGTICVIPVAQAQQHLYHYDDPGIQRTVNQMKARHDYLTLRPGATLVGNGRLVTITVVHRDGVALLVEGTFKNLTKEPMPADSISLQLNESPDRQMKWFKAHPVTPQYHYGPGWNSHNETAAETTWADPGKTGTFVAVWNIGNNSIAAEPLTDLVILL